MNEHVQMLSKKHGQLKQAITKMVQVVMTFLDDTPDMDVKLSVIEMLRIVTEGKVTKIPPPPTLPHTGKLTTMFVLDLRRGRTRPHHPHTLAHQEVARRPRWRDDGAM